MHGQGRPRYPGARQRDRLRYRKYLQTRSRSRWVRACALIAGTVSIFVTLLTGSLSAQETDIRLQVTWGGGAARQWHGVMQVAGGTFSELKYLGLEADAVAAIFLQNNAVQIRPPTARDYDGFEVLVKADLTATLTMELAPTGQPQETSQVEIPLSQLVSDYYYSKLDAQGNQILIHRAGGDTLRVEFERDSLVFAPGEEFQFSVQPHLLGNFASESLRCQLELVESRGGAQVWSQEAEVERRLEGGLAALGPFNITLPDAEGAYEIRIALHRRRFRDTFVPSRPVHQRKLQLVVVATESTSVSDQLWELVDAIDPLGGGWMNWIQQVPKLPLIPDFRQEPVGDRQAEPRDYLDRKLAQLGHGGWQAYPVPIRAIGQPHILDVEYPSDIPQTLGISIVEPNAVGKVVPIGLDSGVNVGRGQWQQAPRLLHHRLLFWPRTNTPFVVLSNRRDHGTAMFGKIQVFAGPVALDSVDVEDGQRSELPGSVSPDAFQSRLIAAYFEKPLFPENFSAPEVADDWSGRSLEDWNTFLAGGNRLVQYLKYTGYNAAVVTIACQGSAIYPSRQLMPNPKYDTGVYFSNGQDPLRKDVLELLFRLFDRAGLRLIPAIQFSSPLPELERMRQQQPGDVTGIDLVDAQGQRWVEQFDAERGSAPYYNPLDPRVQRAMRHVVTEVVDRYSQHPSFAGISLALGPHTYAAFPGADWGRDPVTLQRFHRGRNSNKPQQPEDAKLSPNSREFQNAWLKWRSRELAKFHHTILADIQQRRGNAKLFLLSSNLFANPRIASSLRPTLPNRLNLTEVMLQFGLEAEHYERQPAIVLPRPDRIAAEDNLVTQAVNINLSTNPVADQYFDTVSPAGSVFLHETHPASLPGFDQASPFGKDNTHVLLVPHVPPSAHQNRRRFVHRLALRDEQYLIDGGWMLPLGQEDSLQPLLRTLAHLPAEKFETVQPPTDGLPTQPIVVRRRSTKDETYLYVVNDSPWTVSAEVDLHGPRSYGLTVFGNGTEVETRQMAGEQTWQLELQPYHVVAATVSSQDLKIPAYRATIDRTTYARLRQQVNAIRARAGMLDRPPAVETLLNPGFEIGANEIPGWSFARGAEITIEADPTEHFSGNRALKLASNGPVAWVRSEPIEPPRTGRISVIARLKTEDPTRQPPLQVALEWRQDGKTEYRSWEVGAGRKAQPLGSEWGQQPFLVQFTALPTSGVQDLRIGFDLMGAGTVWVDDVEIYDLWFLPNERDELMIMTALAARSLSKGQVSDCQRILGGYWPQFLRDYVAVDQHRMAALPTSAPTSSHYLPPPQREEDQNNDPPSESSMLDKMKRWPGKVLPFRMKY
jgi:hypothetical protein